MHIFLNFPHFFGIWKIAAWIMGISRAYQHMNDATIIMDMMQRHDRRFRFKAEIIIRYHFCLALHADAWWFHAIQYYIGNVM